MRKRNELLLRLARDPFDILVIGGGILGAGIARDAAMRGLKVGLIEQGDFAGGTSSKTSKLIHGGLRYLEQGRLRLVFESLKERHTLRTIAPELVHPLSLLLPIYRRWGRPVWKINVGLWLYDLLAVGRGIERHRFLSARQAAKVEPGLEVDGLRAVGEYADCQMDDARLCLANILQAVGFGAVCCNYVRLEAFLKADGRLAGAVTKDVLTGRSIEIQSRVVVNATGPWADRLRRLSRADAAACIAPTKGSHLVLPRLSQRGLFVQTRSDSRTLFILPWGDYSLVGTTERALKKPLEAVSADSDEVAYLLEEVNRILPQRRVSESDIVTTFAGARPLLAFSGSANHASREHRIEIDPHGLISVMGGKYTTYRLIAEQVVDRIISRYRWRAERCVSGRVRLIEEVQPVAVNEWEMITQRVDPELLSRLLVRYGVEAIGILRRIIQAPVLARPVCSHHLYIEAEFVHAIEEELACTVTDVLARRMRMAWSSCQGVDCLSRLTEIFERCTGMSREMAERQVDAYHQFLSNGFAFRGPAQPAERRR